MSADRVFDPDEMAARGRIGAYATHSKHDVKQTTQAARDAFFKRFELEVDPEGVLPDPERRRRAEAARKLYYARLSYKSAQARRAKKKARESGAAK